MRSKCILMIVALVLVGCDKAEGGGTTTPSNITNKVITPEDKKSTKTAGAFEEYKSIIVKPIEINLDDLTFEEAFEIEYLAKGEGHTFWWNGEEYTTDMYISTGNHRWVRNSNDKDDACFSNEWDECDVCDGPGKVTWYIDLDGDGLGNPNNYTKTCTYPSVDDE